MMCSHFDYRQLNKHGWIITVELYSSTIAQWKVGTTEQYDVTVDDGDVTSITIDGETKMADDNLTENMDVSVDVDAHQLCTKCGQQQEL